MKNLAYILSAAILASAIPQTASACDTSRLDCKRSMCLLAGGTPGAVTTRRLNGSRWATFLECNY